MGNNSVSFASTSPLEPLRIGAVEIPNRAFLAPMSGVSDLPFRRLAARFGAGLVVSEMVACEQFVDGDDETALRAEGDGIFPHVVQLAGREARWMHEAAKRAEAAGADIVDINMGCPAKKVTSGYSGSALMRDLDHAMTLVEATVKAVGVPVTLKMRLGWDERSINAPELARRAQDAGVKMVTVHGRTRCQFYKGAADWAAIRRVRDAIDIPLVANGDCKTTADARRMMELSGADAVMIGRGAYGRPWQPGVIGAELAGNDGRKVPAGAGLADLVAEHYEMMLAHHGVEVGRRAARKHLGWYMDEAGGPVCANLRRSMLTCDDPAEVLRMIPACFSGSILRSAA
ncbi:tRNA dihydrouridine synthase DusB [Stappia sp. GBMRC 2046]|uniref:tRNA-dihydrouridine synthase n=1 Tax=Stappia sediminis TaxID=2692190 RepID=A0A7X3S9L0_9HYPH|nr:tRNA dihydrouridine synthase DusB [Stappia sediminis]MXN66959.1 tRNA dihydrouridine synthase DusB [Stappia sediminis]